MTRTLPLFFLSCASASGIDITAPEKAPADSAQGITIVARPTFRGAAMPDGTKVLFRTDQGSFSQMDATISSATVPTAGAEARASVFPPNVAGPLKVTVSFTNPNREPVNRDVTIVLELLQPADAGQIAIGCAATAVGALVSGAPALSIDCSLSLRTTAGDPLAGGQATFHAEAGSVSDLGGQADGTRKFVYKIAPGNSPPKDVSANAIESNPNSGDSVSNYLVTVANGRDYNPRDGVATILVVVRAHEQFDDLDGNGKFDAGVDAFTDEPEPFLDVDDDGLYNANAGDKFVAAFDLNKNGIWDGPNGVYDADTLVGRSTHILWTGEPSLYAQPTGNIMIPPGGSSTVNVFMRDINGNPPTGFDSTDSIDLTSSSESTKVVVSGVVNNLLLSTDIGMIFDTHGVFVEFARDGATHFPLLRRFPVTISDQRPADARINPVNVTLSGHVRFSPFPRDQSTVSKTITLTDVPIIVQGTGR